MINGTQSTKTVIMVMTLMIMVMEPTVFAMEAVNAGDGSADDLSEASGLGRF